MGAAAAEAGRRARWTEVADMTADRRHLPCARVLRTARSAVLHSRPHIDLQRVAGALCRS
ncbi:putative leader peptide [Streptomyces griseofuscus]